MSGAPSILMTADEIRAELGWSNDMVRRLLRFQMLPLRGGASTNVTEQPRPSVGCCPTTVGGAAK